MSIHIAAKPGEIAKTVLLPGDPLRAKHIAETMLEDVVCYNQVRNMLGYTGTYKGKRVSVQGTGMGMPSTAIYAHELVTEYGARKLIRAGSCGAIQPDLALRDVILAMSACTDSSFNRLRFNGMDYAPTAGFRLLKKAYDVATHKGIAVKVGSILSSDNFYNADPEQWKLWASYGVLAIEMETSALYTLAAKHHVEALTILTVSDSLVTNEEESAEAREKAFTQMFEIAFEIAE
jgi:purine-nucleoside phosphorylase